MLPSEVGQRLGHVALVEALEAVELALGIGHVRAFAQHGHVKAAAGHLHQLVDQHVAGGAQLARKLQAAAQRAGLAEGRPSVNLGNCRSMRSTPARVQLERVGVVGQFNDFQAFRAWLVLVSSYYFHSDKPSGGFRFRSWGGGQR